MNDKAKRLMAFLLLVVAAAPLSALSIGKMKDNPDRYGGNVVRLRGDVKFKASVPFTELLVYILEDRTGSVLVFSAYPKERDERVSIKAQVVAYVGQDNESGREDVIETISDYLVEKEILERDDARKVSEISLKFINTMAEAATGVWFVIEQEKTGFLNL